MLKTGANLTKGAEVSTIFGCGILYPKTQTPGGL